MIRYQITDGSAHLDEERWLASLNPTADFIQIREPNLSARALTRLVAQVRYGCQVPKLLINDRTDIAIACDVAGVHLRGGSASPEVIRRIAPKGFIITLACHSEEDVHRAEGADYAILAPIFKPLSKSDDREPLGLDALEGIARRALLPIIALGGITEANLAQCIAAGAAGVAGITFFRRP